MSTKQRASLRERLQQKREDLKKRGPGLFLTCKEGVSRFRVLPVGEENEFAMETIYFYLGLKDHMGVVSPSTFGEKCAIMNAHNELSASKKEEDRKFAKKFRPQKKFFAPVIKYKDEAGREIDRELGPKLLLLTPRMYQEAIDLFLDEDNGDFTDPLNGYDLKIKRTGKGLMDTEYKVMAGKTSKLDKEFRKPVDLEAMVREIIPNYKETKKIIEEFLNLPQEEEDEEEERPKKKSKKKLKKDL